MAPEPRFEIVFKNPTGSFHPGEVMQGHVNLELRNEMKIKGIKIYIQGSARVHWDEKRAYTKGSSSKLSHKNTDVYLNESMVLLRKGKARKGQRAKDDVIERNIFV